MRVLNGNKHNTHETYLQQLENRLHHGDVLIQQLEAEGQDVSRHTEHWLNLLREYEQAYQSELEAA